MTHAVAASESISVGVSGRVVPCTWDCLTSGAGRSRACGEGQRLQLLACCQAKVCDFGSSSVTGEVMLVGL